MEEMYRVFGKFIILREKSNVWAINILPDDILIDNYHGHTHIHMEEGIKKISFNDPNKVFFKIFDHITRKKRVDKYKLLEELR